MQTEFTTPQVRTANKECEVCGNDRLCSLRRAGSNRTMWFCDSCWESEQKALAELKSAQIPPTSIPTSPNVGDSTLTAISVNEVLAKAAKQDASIAIRADLFNAATVAITDIKAAIDGDESIPNKPFALAQALMDRFEHFKRVVFNLNEQLMEAGSNQRAIQSYLNTLANQLRAEEREKLKLADLNYKPAPPKAVKTKSITTTGTGSKKKPKIDKAALRKAAAEMGISEFTLQMVVVSKGCTIEQAVETIKTAMAAAKAN